MHDVTLSARRPAPRFGPGRVGAGRVDVASSPRSDRSSAFNADGGRPRSASSFETRDVLGTATEVKTIRMVNPARTAQTYDLGDRHGRRRAGVAFSLPGGSSVTVPAGERGRVDVQMDADAALMDHTREATVAATQAAPGAAHRGSAVRTGTG